MNGKSHKVIKFKNSIPRKFSGDTSITTKNGVILYKIKNDYFSLFQKNKILNKNKIVDNQNYLNLLINNKNLSKSISDKSKKYFDKKNKKSSIFLKSVYTPNPKYSLYINNSSY